MYTNIFHNHIELIKKEARYREFRCLEKNIDSQTYKHQEQAIEIWCSNDYLGLSMNQDILNAVHNATKKYGVGAGGTRNISGTSCEINKLEKNIANFHSKESGLVFTSGYVANLGAISAIGTIIPDMVIFSDENNHASIIAGIKASGCEKRVFKHNNIDDLHNIIKEYHYNKPKLIIFEGVYSMDGTVPNLSNIIDIAKTNNAMTYIDEVHATGLYGDRCGGIAQHFGYTQDIDIIQGTFGKSFGLIGGYITGNAIICDAIRLTSRDFIFTTALPPNICAGINQSIQIVQSDEGIALRNKHFIILQYLKECLRAQNIDFLNNNFVNTHIIPIIIGDANIAKQISEFMLEKYNIYIQNINYPTVRRGQERLRITINPMHTYAMIENLVEKLKFAMSNFL